MNNRLSSQERVAEAFISGLFVQGIEYVFSNGGTDFAPIVEALAEANNTGRNVPRFINVPHENLAMSMANGYYRVAGKPAAVMVHTTPGTANALCGLMNATKDHVPVLLAAGRTPLTETGFAESRDLRIHWGQENFDQGSMVREYVKWDYELRSGQPVEHLIGRALDIAMSEPKGPVYLSLPREVLGQTITANNSGLATRSPGTIPAEPSRAAIQETAKMIAGAEFPLIVTSTVGRNQATVDHLAVLTEEFAIGVVQPGVQDMNLPSNHPMHLGYQTESLIGNADVVIVVDCDVPWIPSKVNPPAGSKVIHISADPLYSKYPIRGFQIDLPIAGSSVAAIPMLYEALNLMNVDEGLVKRRREVFDAARQQRLVAREAKFEEAAAQSFVHPALITKSINELKSENSLVVNELGLGFAPTYLDITKPGSFISGGSASGLGFGLGAALGAKLADRNREVITVVGDGSFMFGNPIPFHYVARAEDLPVLTIISNNSSWHAIQRATLGVYPDGAAARANKLECIDFDLTNHEKTIEASGGLGLRVDRPEDLHSAFEQGLEAVRSGTPAIVNVVTQGRA